MAINRSADPNRSRAPKLPGIPTPSTEPRQLLRFMEVVKEYLEVRESDRATQHDRYVTFRDLEAIGIRPYNLRLSDGNPKPDTVTFALAGGGFASIAISEFERAVYGSSLFQSLVKRLDDPSRFDALPKLVREALLSDLAAEARLRGADIQRLERKIQDADQSLALRVETLTASLGSAVAAVRETAWAAATESRASAGKITQVEARLDDVGGATIEESIITIADRTDGLRAQYTIKLNAGQAVAGFGLAATDVGGEIESSFFIQADKFALVPNYTYAQVTTPSATAIGQTWYNTTTKLSYRATSTGTGGWTLFNPTVPFGVDTTTGTTYINGQVLINAGGRTLDQVGKSLTLSASAEVFKTDQAGAITPSSIALTASLNGGLPDTVVWSTNPSVTLTGTGNSRTLSSADMGANTAVQVTASVSSGGATYSDTFTVYRLADGSDALTGLLTNEAHTVPASSAGVVSSFSGASGSFPVYRGSTLLSSGVSYSIPSGGNPSGLTATINSTTGAYSVTGAGSWANGSTTTTLTLRATIGTTTIDKVFTLTKSAQGATGATGATGAAGDRGALIGAGAAYGIRASVWSDAKANRVISNLLNGESLTTDLTTTAHLEIGDTVTLSGGQLWERTRNAYAAATAYAPGDVVLYTDTAPAESARRERLYRALAQTTGNAPTGANIGTRWAALATPPENYSSTRAYAVGEHAYYLSGGVNRLYRAIASTTGNLPTNTSFWVLVGPSSIVWAAGNSYVRGSVAFDEDSATFYYANSAHVAGANWLADRDGSAFAETRFWAGVQGWQTVGVTIDGNAIVKGTFVADRLVAGNSSVGVSVAGTTPVTNVAGQSITNGVYVYQNSETLYGLYAKNSYNGSTGGVAFFESVGGWTVDSVITGGFGTVTINSTTFYKSAGTFRANFGGWIHLGPVKATSGQATHAAYAYNGVYAPFTGSHDALLPKGDDCEPGDIVVDVSIVSRIGLSDTIGTCARSEQPNQPGAIGVMTGRGELVAVAAFLGEDRQELPIAATYRATHDLISVNALGEGQINVCGEGGDIALGDLIVTSSIPGKGMRQADDIVRSRTVARAREAVTFDGPAQVKQIACIYLCG